MSLERNYTYTNNEEYAMDGYKLRGSIPPSPIALSNNTRINSGFTNWLNKTAQY
jgi:hypothetical protein